MCVKSIKNDTDTIQSGIEENVHSAKRRKKKMIYKKVRLSTNFYVIILQMKNRFSYHGHLQAVHLQSVPKYWKEFPVLVLETASVLCTFISIPGSFKNIIIGYLLTTGLVK